MFTPSAMIAEIRPMLTMPSAVFQLEVRPSITIRAATSAKSSGARRLPVMPISP